MSARATPFYCPFCGEEDLRPHGARHGAWLCRGCTRVFNLSLVGLAPPVADDPDGGLPPDSGVRA